MSKNTGGPAFPVEKRWAVPNERFEGMTLRDYFAAKVLSGYMATSYPAEGLKHVSVEENDAMIAQHCYALADAMLAEREKGETK